MDPNEVVSSVILRRKNSPESPPFSASPLEADLDSHDAIDEHGNVLTDEALANLKQQQKEGISGAEPHIPVQGAEVRADSVPAAPMANNETRHTVHEVNRTKAPEVTTPSHSKERTPTRRRVA